jgi:hypothetical protein
MAHSDLQNSQITAWENVVSNCNGLRMKNMATNGILKSQRYAPLAFSSIATPSALQSFRDTLAAAANLLNSLLYRRRRPTGLLRGIPYFTVLASSDACTILLASARRLLGLSAMLNPPGSFRESA